MPPTLLIHINYDIEPMMSDVLRKNQYSPTAAGIIGGLVGLLLFFIPFSPLLGGGISSFLMRSPDNSALVERSVIKAGSIAGGVVLIPIYLFYIFLIIFVVGRGDSATSIKLFGEALIGFSVLFGYCMGLGILGSLIVMRYDDTLS
jgi:hypothetical protein